MTKENLETQTPLVMCSVEEICDKVKAIVKECLILAQYGKDPSQEENDKLLSTNQVMARLGKNRSTLWRWEKNNYLRPVKVGGLNYYKESEIKEIEDRRK